jgi:hypothetical protein
VFPEACAGLLLGAWLPSAAGFISDRVFTKLSCKKLIPTQIRQLVLHISDNKGYVDGLVGGLTFAKRLYKKTVR